ncbi:MAG: ribosomal-processing cysteine protease Prp [Clostridia bacterium]|nr:ribosomal-processing cysteine protease Prp [Clostridia bacterium]
MISVRFFNDGDLISGFSVSGHAGLAQSGRDILCAAVSSAAYMAANTLIEICSAECETEVSDGFMEVRPKVYDSEGIQIVLKGLSLHLRELSAQYPKQMKIIYGGK